MNVYGPSPDGSLLTPTFHLGERRLRDGTFSEAHSKSWDLKTGSDDYTGCVFQAMLSGIPNGVEAEKEPGAVSSAGERSGVT